ncbi:hypothetical protein [Nitratireductor sp. L15S-10]|uniref:hypothetical protein n=1 Tax=Nitratireductor sp. L15S-10 TaxID=3034028 RepID=UPI003857BBB6
MLEAKFLKLQRRVRALDSGFDRQIHTPFFQRRVDRFSLQEGFVSAIWQTWCAFCRDLLICSTQGATTKNGQITQSPYSSLTMLEIAYLAKEFSHSRNPKKVKPLSGSHLEHTWGDISKINIVANGLKCSNLQSILNAISLCNRITDLQLCRNASAHLSKDSLISVKKAKVRYSENKFEHPSDMIKWIDPSNNNFLWKSWIEEIEIAAEFAIQ